MTWRRFQAIRGATTASEDAPAAIREATRELLRTMVERNGLARDELVSVLFSVTADLATEYPARAARELGWDEVSLLCLTEIPVPGGLPRCIRVLMHVEHARPRCRLQHVYLRDAVRLRPDLSGPELAAPGRVP
ncbi:MAG TPA: chorismate mutase [Gemmatimonadales bacterium]|jgi:chorismate mutase|nr:chorismate mutase [Gemmatimonadales bacterium]